LAIFVSFSKLALSLSDQIEILLTFRFSGPKERSVQIAD